VLNFKAIRGFWAHFAVKTSRSNGQKCRRQTANGQDWFRPKRISSTVCLQRVNEEVLDLFQIDGKRRSGHVSSPGRSVSVGSNV